MAGPYAYPTGWYRPRTPEGLKYTTFALVLAAGGSVLGGLVALSLPEMVGPYPGIGRFTGLCAGAIFGFVAVILFLAGFHGVYTSREEFGPEQTAWTERALWALVLAVIAILVGGSLEAVLVLGIAPGSSAEGILLVTLEILILSLLVQIPIALAVLLPVRALVREESLPLLSLTVILFILSPLATYGTALALGPSAASLVPPAAAAIGGLFGAVPLLLSAFLYLGVQGRIRRGEVSPVPPRPLLYPMYIPPYPIPYAPGAPYLPPYGVSPYPMYPAPVIYGPPPPLPPVAPPPAPTAANPPAPPEKRPEATVVKEKKEGEA